MHNNNVRSGGSSHYVMVLIKVEMRIRLAYLTLCRRRRWQGVQGEEHLAGVVGRTGGSTHPEDAHRRALGGRGRWRGVTGTR